MQLSRLRKHLKGFILGLFFICIASPFLYCADNPKPKGWVSDYAGVLSEQKKSELEYALEQLENKTSAEVAVVIIKSLEGQSLEEYAVQLFQQYGIGKKGKDNGVLFLISTEDKRTRIEVGYGLEGILTDGRCGQLLDDYVVPHIKNGDFENAVVSGTAAIIEIIDKEYGGNPNSAADYAKAQKQKKMLQDLAFIVFLLIFFGFRFFGPIFFGGFFGGFGGGGFGGGGFGGFGGGMSGGGGASR